MNQRRVLFLAPGRVRVEERPAPHPTPDEVLVATHLSAISPGTEMLVYRGQWPAGVKIDDTIGVLDGVFAYPLAYGYSTVGQVVAVGERVSGAWLGQRVFAFHPHQDLFRASPAALHPIPDDIDDETALFLATMETAITLLLDGQPLIGEKVVVCGQGIVGLLTTALLAQFPLTALITLDCHPLRREASLAMGASAAHDPTSNHWLAELGAVTGGGGEADLVYELSGNPAALNTALSVVRFSGRVVVGSWYGAKKAELGLGSFFHRGRISLISSQVSSIAPALSGRWQGHRRLDLAWELLRRVGPARCISHRFDLADAATAYDLIDRSPGETLQVIFDHRAGQDCPRRQE